MTQDNKDLTENRIPFGLLEPERVMTYNSTTTLKHIRKAAPSQDGWTKLLAYLGKTKADDEPLELLTVLDSNGLYDALWVLSYAMPDDRLTRHFQAWCAEQVLHIFEAERPNDTRIRDQIAMLRNDEATDEDRRAATDAAWDASRDASWDACWSAVRATAWVAAWDAVRATACSVERHSQEEQLRKMIEGEQDD